MFSIYIILPDRKDRPEGKLYVTDITVEELPRWVFSALRHSNRIEVVQHEG